MGATGDPSKQDPGKPQEGPPALSPIEQLRRQNLELREALKRARESIVALLEAIRRERQGP